MKCGDASTGVVKCGQHRTETKKMRSMEKLVDVDVCILIVIYDGKGYCQKTAMCVGGYCHKTVKCMGGHCQKTAMCGRALSENSFMGSEELIVMSEYKF